MQDRLIRVKLRISTAMKLFSLEHRCGGGLANDQVHIFQNNDLSGKNLVPFLSHAGSGLSRFDRSLGNAAPDSEILDGLAISRNDAQNDRDSVRGDVNNWIAGHRLQ